MEEKAQAKHCTRTVHYINNKWMPGHQKKYYWIYDLLKVVCLNERKDSSTSSISQDKVSFLWIYLSGQAWANTTHHFLSLCKKTNKSLSQ